MIHKSISLKYEPASEPLHISVKQLICEAETLVWCCRAVRRFDDAARGALFLSRSAPPPVGSERRRGRWGTPTMALHTYTASRVDYAPPQDYHRALGIGLL